MTILVMLKCEIRWA